MGPHLQLLISFFFVNWIDCHLRVDFFPIYEISVRCILLCGLVDIFPFTFTYMTCSKITEITK